MARKGSNIQARKSVVAKGAAYIMYPHGMSAYQDRLVVSSTVHPDLATGVGNAITIIDLNTLERVEAKVQMLRHGLELTREKLAMVWRILDEVEQVRND